MKPWVRKVILVCLFAAIIIYMGLQIPYRNQSLTFNKNAALFDSVMQQVSGHLTENPEIKIYMDGDVYVAEGMEAEYDITEDEKLVSDKRLLLRGDQRIHHVLLRGLVCHGPRRPDNLYIQRPHAQQDRPD